MMNVTSSQVENMFPSVSDFEETHGESGNHCVFFSGCRGKKPETQKNMVS